MSSFTFYDAVEHALNKLASSYEEILKASKQASAETLDYTLAFRSLNTAIEDFRRDMKHLIHDYAELCEEKGTVTAHEFIINLEKHLSDLKSLHARVLDTIPKEALRKGLGKNFKFHEQIQSLTAESLYHFFAINKHLAD